MELNQIIIARIIGIQPYGLFVEYETYQGLVHISEISDFFVGNLEESFPIGGLIEVCVIGINEDKNHLQLSYKKANKIHPKVLKQVPIVIGFSTLFNRLSDWIKTHKKDKGE